MDTQKPIPGTAGGLEHYNFIDRSDRRNLRTQLKNLVSLAQDIALKDLNERREKLRKLIEIEDKTFEEEFANSAKARLQSEIKKPMTTTEKDAEQMNELRKKKRIQQSMNCCYEVREALRQKDCEETRICLEEQMLENERKVARQREMDRYWLNVQEVNFKQADERQRHEDCVKEWRRDQIRHVLGVQLQEKEAKLEAERKEKAAEVERINNLIKELQQEEINRSRGKQFQKSLEYRKKLQDMMEAKRREREQEHQQLVAERCQLMSDIAREEEEERKRIALAKQEHKKSLLDFIEYVQRMRKLEEDIDKVRYDRIEDLGRVDICTKSNVAELTRRKAEEAEKCYAELRRQVCEQLERRKLEEIERREDKIIENRFAHPEIPRSVILAQRRQMREDLDKQIAEMRVIRAQEEEKYKNQLMKAVDDPEVCRQLAEEYIRDGIDYLDPHSNWLILLDPCKPKSAEGKMVLTTNVERLMRHPVREPLLPVMTCTPHKLSGPCSKMTKDPCSFKDVSRAEKCVNKCIVPFGCAKRSKNPC